MKERIEALLNKIDGYEIKAQEQVEQFRLEFLSKKGELNDLFEDFKTVPNELKKEIGQKLNQIKVKAQAKFEEAHQMFGKQTGADKKSQLDLTLSAEINYTGSRHPLAIVENQVIDIFKKLGFVYSEGPEIEDDWHNFSALNFPKNHPARDMQDTFFIAEEIALRTHTSSVQVRLKENS